MPGKLPVIGEMKPASVATERKRVLLVIQGSKDLKPEATLAVSTRKPIKIQDNSLPKMLDSVVGSIPKNKVLTSSRHHSKPVSSRQRSRVNKNVFVIYGQNRTLESLAQSSTDSLTNKVSTS